MAMRNADPMKMTSLQAGWRPATQQPRFDLAPLRSLVQLPSLVGVWTGGACSRVPFYWNCPGRSGEGASVVMQLVRAMRRFRTVLPDLPPHQS
jgi:hypothetical protein